MLELLILYSLIDKNLTTYGIKKNITDDFEIFYKPSFGAVHPALTKLLKAGYIEISTSISNGGQKSILHHLLPSGKKYFYKLWSEITATTATKIWIEVIIKIIMLPKISNQDIKTDFLENASNMIELTKYDVKNSLEKNSNGYFQTSTSLFYKEICTLQTTLEQLKKENCN